MRRSTDRILTTHVGSMVRPPDLVELSKQVDEVEGAGAFDARLLQEIDAVVRRQVETGIDIVNEGEFSKSSWAAYILERISGFEIRPDMQRPLYWLGRDRERFKELIAEELPSASVGTATQLCTGPIAYLDPAPVRGGIEALKSAMERAHAEEGFFTTVAPASAAYNGENACYPSEREYVMALSDALREEYQEIYKSGLLVQVDDAVLANMYDELVQQSPERYREWAELRVEGLNRALEGIPEDRVRYHICFGSWHLPHVADAPLAELAELILEVKAGAYSIEAANPRHEHEWRVWEEFKLPPEKILLPGVVTHHTTTVEHPRLVADRIVRYARIVGRENVIASTDCGFAQNEGIRRVHPSVMWAKLEALVEGARIATKELWGR